MKIHIFNHLFSVVFSQKTYFFKEKVKISVFLHFFMFLRQLGKRIVFFEIFQKVGLHLTEAFEHEIFLRFVRFEHVYQVCFQ